MTDVSDTVTPGGYSGHDLCLEPLYSKATDATIFLILIKQITLLCYTILYTFEHIVSNVS